MKKLFANLKTAYDVITGRFTLIKLNNNELIVLPSKMNNDKIKQVAIAFFREAYNLQ